MSKAAAGITVVNSGEIHNNNNNHSDIDLEFNLTKLFVTKAIQKY